MTLHRPGPGLNWCGAQAVLAAIGRNAALAPARPAYLEIRRELARAEAVRRLESRAAELYNEAGDAPLLSFLRAHLVGLAAVCLAKAHELGAS